MLLRLEGSGLRRAIARDENGEAIFELVFRQEIGVVRLKPADGPVGDVGLRAGHGDSISGDKNKVEFGVEALGVSVLERSFSSPPAPLLPAGNG